MTTSTKQYRGITNINKTSCHTSSSIQLLYHCFPQLTNSIIDLAECSAVYHVQQLYNKKVRRGSDGKKNKSTKETDIAENDKEEGGGDNDVIESEFVYQLSWFYYLLTYNIDILEVSRTKFAKKREEESAKQQAIAVASFIGIQSTDEEYFTSPLQSVTSEEFHTILNEAAASPPRTDRKHKKKKKHNRHRHHRDDASRTSKTPSHKNSRNKSRGTSSLSSVPTPSPTKLSPTKLKQPSEMNSAQKAAISNFMQKAKNGTSTTNDWQRLVEVMKDNNRSMYSGALNMILDGRDGGGEGQQNVSPLRTDFDETSEVRREKQGKVVDDKDDLLLQQPILDEGKVDTNERSESDKTTKISNLKQLQDAIDTFGEDGGGSTTIGNLGGGKPTSNGDDPTPSDQVQVDAVNPTSFYEHINTYTSNLSTQSSKTHLSNVHINTSNVGDAGQVFRCLVSVLEYSVNEEINRLQSILDVLEIDSWNKRDNEEEKVEVGEEDTTHSVVNEKQLLQKLKSIQSSLEHSFGGTLISRIVGTSISVTTQTHNPMLPFDSDIDNRDCTTITKVQRTKKNGGIERKLPVPLVLPVVKAELPTSSMVKQKKPKKNKTNENDDIKESTPTKKNYFPSIEESLYSITIHPNPIRGYDWRQLMKRNEVNEDVFIKKIDSDGNEILENEEVEKEEVMEDEDDLIRKLSRESLENIVDDIVNNAEEYDDDEENSFISDVASVVENEKKNHPMMDHEERSVSSTEYIHTTIQRSTSQGSVNGGSVSSSSPKRQIRSSFDNDDISVLSTASRSIACQTEVDDNGDPVHGMNVRTIEVRSGLNDGEANAEGQEEEKTEEELDNTPPSTDIIEKDACYAAAVAAIVSARGKSTSVASRHRRSRSAAATKRAPSVDRGRRAYKSGRATERPPSRNRNSNEERSSRARSTTSEQVAPPSRVRGTSVGSRGRYQGRSVDEYNRIRGTSVDSRRSLRGTSVERRSSRYKGDATSVDSRRNNSSGLLRSNSVGQRMVEATTAAIPPTTTPGSGESGKESKEGGEPKTISYDSSPSLFAPLPGITTPRGMEIGDSNEQGITIAYMPSPTNSLDYDKNDDVVLPLDSDDSSSDDDSSVDDHVSSVDTDTTSEDGGNNEQPNLDGVKKDDDDLHSFSTKSSDIDTPENIDELSLGSFTDDSELSDVQVNLLVEGGDNMKGDIGNTTEVLQNETMAQPPVVEEEGPKEDLAAALKQDLSAINNDDKNDPKRMEVEPPSLGSTSYSAVSDSNSDDSSSSSSSDSSTSSSSSSSSSDDTSSSESSSTDSSDDNDENGGKPDTTIAAAVSSNTENDDDSISSSDTQSQPTNEWVTRKETRFETLPQSLVFHLKRFEYSPTLGRVEKLPGEVLIPQVLDVKACSLVSNDEKKKDKGGDTCYQYRLTGGIVHVDPVEDEEDVEYGQTSEGHYVTFICKSPDDPQQEDMEEKNVVWTEIDDEVVRTSDADSALKILSGCESSFDKKEKDRRYATLVVYTRDV